MKSVFHTADGRGKADFGWLRANYSFSFANYYNPERMSFGVLRVLNDDHIDGGRGFKVHPHDNMEIVSIPLSGALEHEDDMGNKEVIKAGDIQVMSAGKGVYHSEKNYNSHDPVKLLQIWMMPNERDVTPRYDQISLDREKMSGKLQQILSPNPDDDGVWVHQNAWWSMGDLSADQSFQYKLHNSTINGVYAFLLSGELDLDVHTLTSRDAVGVWETDSINLTARQDSRILVMEVPML